MPTVLRIGAFRFFFYSNENAEPEHIHIQSGEGEAKYWLNPVSLNWNRGFNERQLKQIERYIDENLQTLKESWVEFFGEDDDEQG
ncbi:MAG: DUF4160 domain-containing protein [Chloroflexi bacterium]|nr:DUF4160 domain-containing protein [Chloroflexota bacterium]